MPFVHLLFLAAPLLFQGEVASQQVPRLSAEEARADFDLLMRALEHVHPGLYRFGDEESFRDAASDLRVGLRDGVDLGSFYREVSVLLARVRCGHTRAETPAALELSRKKNATHLPFTFDWIEGSFVIDRVHPSASTLRRGDEVIEMDKKAIEEWMKLLGSTVGLDGFTDHARSHRLANAYEFSDSGFDHYLPYFRGWQPTFTLRIQRRGTEEPLEIEVDALSASEWGQLAQQPRKNFDDAVASRSLDEKTALLVVETFVNYRRPVDPYTIYGPHFQRFRDDGIEHLIVDLRSCGGGSDDACWALARYLIAEPLTTGEHPKVKNYRMGDLEEHLSTWDPMAFRIPAELFHPTEDGFYEFRQPGVSFGITPHPDRFEGRVTILCGPANASGATWLLAVLKAHTDVRLVGEETAGSAEGPTAGLLASLKLPKSGIQVNIPLMLQSTGVQPYAPGKGVRPQVLVARSVTDWLKGRDATLEAAR